MTVQIIGLKIVEYLCASTYNNDKLRIAKNNGRVQLVTLNAYEIF